MELTKLYNFTVDQELWLVDLENTEEPQTTVSLCDNGGWCCLGRLCDVLNVPKMEFKLDNYKFGIESDGEDLSAEVLPEYVAKLVGLRSTQGHIKDSPIEWERLTELNDDAGWSFKQIAAFIRQYPEKVFLQPGETPETEFFYYD